MAKNTAVTMRVKEMCNASNLKQGHRNCNEIMSCKDIYLGFIGGATDP